MTEGSAGMNLPGQSTPLGEKRPDSIGHLAIRKVKASIREARLEDYSAIPALHARNGMSTMALAEWTDFWNGNPVCKEVDHWPIGWVLETERREIVGSIANIPLVYRLGNQELIVATASSWVTDPAFRSYSLAILERFMQQKGADLFISTTASPGAEPSLSFFQWVRAPHGAWNQSRYWVTDCAGALKIALASKLKLLARLLRHPGTIALSGYQQFAHRKVDSYCPGIVLERTLAFDDRFDRFWEKLRHENEHVLLGCRDQKTMSWHFHRHLALGSLRIITASRHQSLQGFALLDRQDSTQNGLKRLRIVDLQALREPKGVSEALLQYTLQAAHIEGVHVVECAGSWLDRLELLSVSGSHSRTLSSWMYYYKPATAALAETLKDKRAWATSSFDGDASLGLSAKAETPSYERHEQQKRDIFRGVRASRG